MNVDLLLACNDENGEQEDVIRALQVWHAGESLLDLDGDVIDFSAMSDYIRVDGKLFPAQCIQSWAGNWCWDLFRVSFDAAVWILERARKSGWTAGAGATFLFNSYDDGDPLGEPLRLALAGDETPRRTRKQEAAALVAWNSGEPYRV